ncbi:MAG: glycosyltransferase [Acidimicrobiales bacterium]
MRLLFVSGTTIGGSGRSQRELAARLRARGHDVLVLVDPEHGSRVRRVVYEQLSDVGARLDGWPGAGLVRWLERRPGRRTHRTDVEGIPHVFTPVPENALEGVVEGFRPDVVIGSSVLRLTWRKARSLLELRGVPTVLYIREVEAMNHFEGEREPADAVVANAESLRRRVDAFGVDCTVFPSVIDVDVTRVSSTRRVALVVNPIESRGIDTVWRLAECLPDVPFAAQESWPLTAEQLGAIQRRLSRLPNVELRRAEPPGPRLYRDARVLLVPYRVDNRPRVIAEAQANGIPVIVGDAPALVEAVGGGGVVVPTDDVDGWCSAIRSMWTDEDHYQELATQARRHSERAAISADVVAGHFEEFLVDLLRRA